MNATPASLIVALCGLLACGGPHVDAPSTPMAPPPAELVGLWRQVAVSSSGYTDDTGRYWNAWDDTFSLQFSPDGRLTQHHLQDSALYNCHVTIFATFEGTVVVKGDAMDVYYSHNPEHGEGNCPVQAYDKLNPAETAHLTWKIVQQSGGPRQLWLTDTTNNTELAHLDFQPGGV